ncbi:MAG: hypothetical protein QW821_03190 [Candidatus Bathyarchaeia archaeon]
MKENGATIVNKKIKVGIVLAAVLICAFLAGYFFASSGSRKNNLIAEAAQTLLFAKPAFAQSLAQATTFLDQEAGMTLYKNIGRSIDLSVAKTVFRTLEKETSDYVVGSIALPGLPESEDVHCFVHKDGWIVVYYLEGEPIGKIIDWGYWTGGELTKNKLQAGWEKMGNAIGASVTGAKYYHYQYPYATKCMLIIDTCLGDALDSFNITIPSAFTVYERAWSHYAQSASGYYPAYFKIDGNTINTIYTSGQTTYGTLTPTQLSPTVPHKVSISGGYSGNYLHGVCIALAYKES